MTGSLSVKGEVLPIGAVTAKVEAALAAGIKRAIIPKSNLQDLIVPKNATGKIEIIPVDTVDEVWENALDWKNNKDILKKIKKMHQNSKKIKK